jgi:hypothetical protein
MIPRKSRGYGPFGALRVERETKPDGRYILYYSWPDGRRDAGRAPARPHQREPWSPESGPPDEPDNAGGSNASTERPTDNV